MVKEIKQNELQKHLDEGAILVDVREQEEVDEGAIAGMTHMPLSEFDQFQNQISQDKPTVFYCRSGKRSLTAGKMASQWTDQPVYSLEGGYLSFVEQDQ